MRNSFQKLYYCATLSQMPVNTQNHYQNLGLHHTQCRPQQILIWFFAKTDNSAKGVAPFRNYFVSSQGTASRSIWQVMSRIFFFFSFLNIDTVCMVPGTCNPSSTSQFVTWSEQRPFNSSEFQSTTFLSALIYINTSSSCGIPSL